MSFQEFYCDPVNGDNRNGGTDPGVSAFAPQLALTYNRGTGAGGVDNISGAGNPFFGVVAGAYVGIKAAGGAAPADWVTVILAVNGGGASADVADGTVNTRAVGTRPANLASVDARVGGAWQGPTGASGFPMTFLSNVVQDGNGNWPRVNYKNSAAYSISAQISLGSTNKGVWHEGYTSAVGDGGRAILDGGGASITLLNLSVSTSDNNVWKAFQFQNTTGTGVVFGSNGCQLLNCVVTNTGQNGIVVSSTSAIISCEAYGCNTSNTANQGGFLLSSGGHCERCTSHHNAGNHSSGFVNSGGPGTMEHCIANNNGQYGINSISTQTCRVISCDVYNNASDGFNSSSSGLCYIESTNFVKNGGWGVTPHAATGRVILYNCGFGTGTDANASGDINSTAGRIENFNSISYTSPTNPWSVPSTGDFRIVAPAAQGAGRGTFTQTGNSQTGTVGYPDIGAAQHLVAVTSPHAIVGVVGGSAANNSIDFYPGEDVLISVSVIDVNGAVVDISTWAMTFTILSGGYGGSALITKTVGSGIVITDGPNGKAQITLSSSNTSGLSPGKDRYILERTDTGFDTVLANDICRVKRKFQ